MSIMTTKYIKCRWSDIYFTWKLSKWIMTIFSHMNNDLLIIIRRMKRCFSLYFHQCFANFHYDLMSNDLQRAIIQTIKKQTGKRMKKDCLAGRVSVNFEVSRLDPLCTAATLRRTFRINNWTISSFVSVKYRKWLTPTNQLLVCIQTIQ